MIGKDQKKVVNAARLEVSAIVITELVAEDVPIVFQDIMVLAQEIAKVKNISNIYVMQLLIRNQFSI